MMKPSLIYKNNSAINPIIKALILFMGIIINSCGGIKHAKSVAINDPSLKTSLPRAGRLVNDKPVGNGWVDLIASFNDWNLEKTKLETG